MNTQGKRRYHTELVGRSELLDAIPNSAVVTLVGPAGVGKTRLAAHIAAARGCVAWVSAVSLGLEELRTALARAVGWSAREAPDAAQLATLLAREEVSLVVIDEAESAPDAVRSLVWELCDAAGPNVLVTSRRALDFDAEYVVPVPPLRELDAIELFRLRARRVAPDVADDGVEELVRRLDCVPLAIELAAARAASLSPRQMLDRLDARFELLKGTRFVDAHHRSLELALQTSWEQLDEAERAALASIAMPVTPVAMEHAEELVGGLDAIESLARCSLVSLSGSPRVIAVFESVRDFVQRHGDAAALDAARRSHAEVFARAAAHLVSRLTSRDFASALLALEELVPELRLIAGRDVGDVAEEHIVGAVRSLDAYHEMRGPSPAHDRVLDRLEELAPGDAQAAVSRGCLLLRRGDLGGAARLLEAQGRREGSAPELRARAWRYVAEVRVHEQELRAADEAFGAAAAAAAEGDDARLRVMIDRARAFMVSVRLGDVEGATKTLRNSARALAELGDDRGRLDVLNGLLSVCHEGGHHDDAQQLEREVLQLSLEADSFIRAVTLVVVGRWRAELGAPDEALELADQALTLLEPSNDPTWLGSAHWLAALSAIHAGDVDAGHDALERARATLDLHANPLRRAIFDRDRSMLLQESGELDEALHGYERALERLSDPTQRAWTSFAHALCRAELGAPLDVAQAAAQMRAASRPSFANFIAGFESDEAPPLHPLHRAILDGWRRGELSRELHRRSWYARAAARLFATSGALVVGPECRWFEWRGLMVDIKRRGGPRLILQALVDSHLRDPKASLGVDDLFAAGWPGENISIESGRRRAYTAVNTLRNLGLADVLQTTDDGYRIAPDVHCSRSSG